MSDLEHWRRWCSTIADASDRTSADTVLGKISREIAALLPSDRDLIGEWAEVGIDVELRPLAASGLCVRGTRRVVVRRGDPPRRRRYTVAHEVAHLLLFSAAERSGLRLSRRLEESMCERFASMVLAPYERLAGYLRGSPPQPTLLWLQQAADEFRISHSALVIALGRHAWESHAGYVLAEMSGHRLRPRQVALRIAHAAAPSWLVLAREQRLASLGWAELAAWTTEQKPGTTRCARDEPITIRAAAGRGVASYSGRVLSEAIVVAGAYTAIVAFDPGELRPDAFVRRRRKVAACERQLALAIA